MQLPELDHKGNRVTTCVAEYEQLSGQQSTTAKGLKRMSTGLSNSLSAFNDILDSNNTTDASKDDWRNGLVTLRTLKDPNNSTDIATAKRMFSRSLKELTEAGVVIINSTGSYQYGEDIEPQWSDVKSYVPDEYFR